MNPELVLGTAQFDTSYGIARQTAGGFDPCELLALATSLGVTSLDTAPGYGNAQEMIGCCGWQGRIHTKIPDENDVLGSLEASLLLLRRASIDVAYFHQPTVLKKDGSYFERIHSLVVPNLVEDLGVSIYSPEEFDAALENPFLNAIQAPLSIADNRITDEQLKAAARKEKRVFARSIFLQGALLQSKKSLPIFLSGLLPVIEELDAIERDYGFSRIRVLIQGVLARPGISGLIVGAESSGQLFEIVDAFNALRGVHKIAQFARTLALDDIRIIDPRNWPNG